MYFILVMNKIKQVKTKYGYINVMTNDFIGKYFLKNKYWDDDNINNILLVIKQNKSIIDIGANIGSHTLQYSKYIDDGCKVYSFEPQTFLFKNLLSKTVADNELKNVELFNCALGHKNIDGSMNKLCDKGRELNYNINSETNFGGLNLGKGGEKISIKTLDSFNFDNIGFIKIDVEGAEKLVILGAIQTLKRNRPIVLYENNYKQITNDMRKMFNLTDSEYYFNIELFFLKYLKYSKLERVGDDIICFP